MNTALYRRYRPETFDDVIGQEHVTEPLKAALAGDRVTHAYLFSGPRGCGKTTSARILARCLNCAQGPIAEPCGQCDSCVDLARGGPGSLDVVEIDAASHNGVDDARELRERAAFSPARDRYKIFILDEAHMVTTQGFNALLKVVEEPPAHIKFVFATTEPDKVIGTIRSRTHHYPFRLVAPEKLTEYLQSVARAEGITVAGGVLPLVIRAGGGSVRDSLSVLDQLIAGAADAELTYEHAVALLGFTHAALLDDAVDALAVRDGLSLFRVVDRVIESGHAPRRFVEDLLERLRDLIVVRAAGDEAASVLRSVPADQLERMGTQAQHLGAATLSRAADLVNEALTEMTGATSPRLQLELLCARLLLPAADDGVEGFAARLDRLEAMSAGAPVAPSHPRPAADSADPPRAPAPGRTAPEVGTADPHARAVGGPAPVRAGAAGGAATPDDGARPGDAGTPDDGARPGDAGTPDDGARPGDAGTPDDGARPADAGTPDDDTGPGRHPAADQAGPRASAPPPGPTEGRASPAPGHAGAGSGDAEAGNASPSSSALTTDQVRRRWPEVLETLARLKRTSWALVSQDAQVVELTPTRLTLGFSTEGLATAFRAGPHAQFVARALHETLGVEVAVDPVLNTGAGAGGVGGGFGAPTPAPASDRSAPHPGQAAEQVPSAPPATDTNAAGTNAADAGTEGWADAPVRRPPQDPPPESAESAPDAVDSAPSSPDPAPDVPGPAPGAASNRSDGDTGAAATSEALIEEPARDQEAAAPVQRLGDEPDDPSPDDPDLGFGEVVGAPLVARLLGGTVIDEEIENEGEPR